MEREVWWRGLGGQGGGRIGFERFGDGVGEEEIIGKKNGSGIH